MANQSQFLSEFISMANSNHIKYLILNIVTVGPRKPKEGVGTVEQNWGILNTNNNKKQSFVNFLSNNFTLKMFL